MFDIKPSRNIKIAIVTGSLYMGGAELITLNLSSCLKDLGYNVTIVTVTEPGEWFHLPEERGLKAIHIAGRQDVHPYRHAWRIGKRLLEESFRVVILVKYHNSEPCTQAALNMLPDDVVVIPWVHNDTKETYRNALSNSLAWNAAVGVGVKITNTMKKKINKPIVHIPNGIDMPADDYHKKNERKKSDELFVISYLGRLHHVQKGIFNIPAILNKCSEKNVDYCFNIIGDGPDRNEFLKKFEELDQLTKIKFIGQVAHEEVYKYLFQSHILLMPSYYEAMPTVLIEAQACGCTPIASRLPGITDTIMQEGKTGILVNIDDVYGFVQAIRMLYDNRERWIEMSLAGVQWAKQYSIETMGGRFDELIQACLRGEYPLKRPRRRWLPVNPLALKWRDTIPRQIKNLGVGNLIRSMRNIT